VYSKQSDYEQKVRGQYNGIIYVLGSPAHAIFSLYSRHYERPHYTKLRGRRIPDSWVGNATAAFEASAKSGSDAFGIGQQAHQWMDLQDLVTFGFRNKTMLVPELKTFRRESNSSEYLQSLVKDFLPLFITDIATTRAAPAVFAALLGVTVDELRNTVASTKREETTKKDKKLTGEQERRVVNASGATQIYARLEQEMQQRIKQNYLLFGMGLFCSSSSTAPKTTVDQSSLESTPAFGTTVGESTNSSAASLKKMKNQNGSPL
jgi:hypothetical protein